MQLEDKHRKFNRPEMDDEKVPTAKEIVLFLQEILLECDLFVEMDMYVAHIQSKFDKKKQ